MKTFWFALALIFATTLAFAVSYEKKAPELKDRKFCLLEIRFESSINGDFVHSALTCDGDEPQKTELIKILKPDETRVVVAKLLTERSSLIVQEGLRPLNCSLPIPPQGTRDSVKYACYFSKG